MKVNLCPFLIMRNKSLVIAVVCVMCAVITHIIKMHVENIDDVPTVNIYNLPIGKYVIRKVDIDHAYISDTEGPFKNYKRYFYLVEDLHTGKPTRVTRQRPDNSFDPPLSLLEVTGPGEVSVTMPVPVPIQQSK